MICLRYGYYMVIEWLLYGYGYYMVIKQFVYGYYTDTIWLINGYYVVNICLLYG